MEITKNNGFAELSDNEMVNVDGGVIRWYEPIFCPTIFTLKVVKAFCHLYFEDGYFDA